MRQIIYQSTTASLSGRAADDVPAILRESVAHNAVDGISGLLYTEKASFLQAIGGPEDVVADLLARLRRDPRHQSVQVLSDREIAAREFGGWTMVYRNRRETLDDFDWRLSVLLGEVSPPTAVYFRALS